MRFNPGSILSLAVLCLFLTSSCDKTPIQFGQQYIDNSITNIVLVDSISPTVSTIYKDSVPSAQSGSALVGNYNDVYFGRMDSRSFAQLTPATLPDLLPNAQFDSIAVLLKTNGRFYGDTMLPITLNVNQLSQELKFVEGQYTFYNTTDFPVKPVPLGSQSFVLRPLNGDSAKIRLKDAFGQELFGMIQRKSDTLKTNAVFTDYFKGLQVNTSTNGNIYGFKDSLVLRLYYHQTGVYIETHSFDFSFSNKALQYNKISVDRSGTPLAALNTTNNEIQSTAMGNMGFMQSLTGIYVKISFPTIRKILERADYVKMIKAVLVVKPVAGSFSTSYPLPPQLYAAQTDGGNEPGNPISAVVNGVATTLTGDLIIDNIYGTGTQYSYDVTSYLLQEINNAAINKDGLLLIPTSDARYAAFNRLVMGDVQNLKNRLQLNVFYVSVNK